MAAIAPDIEQAPEAIVESFELASVRNEPPFMQSSPEKGAEVQAKTPLNFEAEKIVVLSFRGLQLGRISELQDELLRLSIVSASSEAIPDDHKEKVDKVMADYAAALRNYETLSINALPSVPPAARLVGLMAMGGAEQPTVGFLKKARAKLAELFPSRDFYSSGSTTIQDLYEAIEMAKAQYEKSPGSTWKLKIRRAPKFKFPRVALPSLPNGIPDGSPMSRTFEALAEAMMRSAGSTEGISPSEIIKAMELTTGNLGFRELDQQARLLRAQKKALTERIVMAMFGGVALIGPMLIMTLHPSKNTSLITVSVATFIFALILAVGATDSAGKDVLGATAAYAAVLVVFVGTSSGGGS